MSEPEHLSTCARCGNSWPVENGPSASACGECPAVQCTDCLEPDDRRCSCWHRISDMAFADVKAVFAASGLGLTIGGESR